MSTVTLILKIYLILIGFLKTLLKEFKYDLPYFRWIQLHI